MTAYYNEFDPYAAQWLRNLISAGHIAPGDVDERSILDVRPDELTSYTQCHFFAGIGVWSYALRRAGWADDRPVWTGSCPCQPFSAAGKGGGFDDERHLWPHFHWLISQCRPGVVLGEQVASKDGLSWLDLVQTDLEGTGYASGAVDLCAAGVGAPHIRQRLWWVAERGVALADAYDAGLEGRVVQPERAGERSARSSGVAGGLEHAPSDGRVERRAEPSGRGVVGGCEPSGLADTDAPGQRGDSRSRGEGDGAGACGGHAFADRPSASFGLAHDDDDDGRTTGREVRPLCAEHDHEHGRATLGLADAEVGRDVGQCGCREFPERFDDSETGRPGPTNGLWRAADWLFCRDGKWRPVEPGTFPLAHGAPARVGRLRGYGNAINAEAAVAFISCLDR